MSNRMLFLLNLTQNIPDLLRGDSMIDLEKAKKIIESKYPNERIATVDEYKNYYDFALIPRGKPYPVMCMPTFLTLNRATGEIFTPFDTGAPSRYDLGTALNTYEYRTAEELKQIQDFEEGKRKRREARLSKEE